MTHGPPVRTAIAIAIGFLVVLASGCAAAQTARPAVTLPSDLPDIPALDPKLIELGESTYRASCAACHGANLEGADDWKSRNDDGTWRPPPMDNSGHTWHHSDSLLIDTITNGSIDPDSAMIGWGDRLSASEIESIIEFFKSTWGDDERAFQWTVTWQDQQRESE